MLIKSERKKDFPYLLLLKSVRPVRHYNIFVYSQMSLDGKLDRFQNGKVYINLKLLFYRLSIKSNAILKCKQAIDTKYMQ